jgi:hypothetical protein
MSFRHDGDDVLVGDGCFKGGDLISEDDLGGGFKARVYQRPTHNEKWKPTRWAIENPYGVAIEYAPKEGHPPIWDPRMARMTAIMTAQRKLNIGRVLKAVELRDQNECAKRKAENEEWGSW